MFTHTEGMRTRSDLAHIFARRVHQQLQGLESLSLRYGWLRIAVFFLGVALFLTLHVLNYSLASWLSAMGCLALFIALVKQHQRVRQSIQAHKLALRLRAEQQARAELDWAKIPALPLRSAEAGHLFESDLDLTGPESLLTLLDTTASTQGLERLRQWLLYPLTEAVAIHARQQLVAALKPLQGMRLQLRLSVAQVNWDQGQAPETRWDQAPLQTLLDAPSASGDLRPWIGILGLLSLANLSAWGLWFSGLAPQWPGQILISIYILLYWSQRHRLGKLFQEALYLDAALLHLRTLTSLLEKRKSKHLALQNLLAPLQNSHRPSQQLAALRRVLAAASLQGNPLVWVLFNLAGPWDFWFRHRLDHLRHDLKTDIPAWLERLTELEAASALATFAWNHPECPFPTLTDTTPALETQALAHPLLPAGRITNDFSLAQIGDAFLITGSNMAGKSTFLKALGSNLVLAYAGSVVCAEALNTGVFRIAACIRVSDSVTDGISYFYAEVRRLKALLALFEEQDARPVFFLIDEIFRGTNNRERLIGSRSYIRALLGKNGLGGISTHDLDLVHVADESPHLHNYHFREQISAGRMSFTYKLQEGPCPSTNALRIMALEGLPVEALELPDNEMLE